jgi:tetratricopeptide (TPR) repeat protein/transcriptional regulator with XRE-family HTH domain
VGENGVGASGFGSLLRARRAKARLTQEELAERSGLSVRAISDLERGVTARPHRSSVALLADALGLEPGDSEAIADAMLPRAADPGPAPAVPRHLPPTVADFVGRAAELDALTDMLDQAGYPAGAVIVSVISGTAGVGKTALAVRCSHQIAERFPDGQLYVDLRGYGPGQPMSAADALAGFLSALGVVGQDIPARLEERAARYRSLLAGRQMLVLLDNAHDVEQVRPMLPATAACPVVVTSRDSLVGLVARDGARRLDLDLLPLAGAVSLLRALIGSRADLDPEATTALAAQCSRLPLALRVAAELAAARPAVPLADLVDELADRQRRLDILNAGGDPSTAVRAVFSWSYRHLHADAARTFRLLSLHPGADFDSHAAAALIGTTVERARNLLAELTRAHLIDPARSGHWGIHDLLRAYACELAPGKDGGEEGQTALTRLFDYYLHTVVAAVGALFPAEHHLQPSIARQQTPGPPVTEPAAARSWLEAELTNLVATVVHAAVHGWPGHAARLAAALFRYLDTSGHYSEAIIIHGHARQAAHDVGDTAAEASALTSLGVIDLWQGRYQEATDRLRHALTLARQADDLPGQARALHLLGNVGFQQGRYRQAVGHFQHSLALYRKCGDRIEIARALGNLGVIDQRQGRFEQAASRLRQALSLCRGTSDPFCEAHVLGNLGVVDIYLDRYQQATDHLQQALRLFREAGNRTGEAHALVGIGDAYRRQGRFQQAIRHQRQALALFSEFGDRSGEAEAHNGLGEAFLATGRPGYAREQHTTALRLARQIGDQDQQARAHNGLAYVYQAARDHDCARRQWEQALALFTVLGAPEADEVRAQLGQTGGVSQDEP